MAVLYTPHFAQFFENDGVTPAAAGLLYTYAAGTTTPKATYTTAAGDIEHTNPIVLDSAGRAVIFISGSYKYVLKDSDGNTIKETDNVTSFNATTANTEGFFQSFSGNAVTTAFTTSDSLGSDEKALMVFSELEYSTNGTFASDTGWTKGTGWTIAAGVATATGAISTALEQSAGITLIQGKQYLVQYTITRSAGTITPSLGGTAGTGRSASGTYSETIIAGSTQTISFGTSGFTGTVDNVSVRDLGGLTIRNVGDYTIDGTTLTFTKAPATGPNNIFVFAPYTLINAAGAAQTAADAAIAAAGSAEAAVNSVAYQFTFDSSTSMADPGTGDFRLNNATLSSVTAIAVDALSSVTGNPDVSDAIAAWGASTSTNKGQIKITKSGTPATYALYNVTAAVTDNTGWLEITVSHVASNGTLTAADVCYLQHTRTGDKGETGATGSVSSTTGVQASTSAGAHLISSGSNDCLQWGAGGGANLTLKANMSGDSTHKLVSMADPTSAQDYATKNYVDTEIAGISLTPPTRQYLTSGTSATYTTPANCTALLVRMVGGGGGGGARNTNNGTAGGNTIFNSVNASGGGGGPFGGQNVAVAAGGSGGSGSAALRLSGGDGCPALGSGGFGAASPFGGGGAGGNNTGAGNNAKSNTGGGGGGGGPNSATAMGGYGGAAGEYVELYITSPAASYTYTIGSGGAGGSAGGVAGGNGGSGFIVVEEYY